MPELWDNLLFPIEERLEMAKGGIAFRDKIIVNLRDRLAASEGCDRNALWSYVAQHAVIVDASVEGMVSITIARDAGSGACAEAAEKAIRALRQPERNDASD